MAGKFEYNIPRTMRAYADGRQAAVVGGSNPHVVTSAAGVAWTAGSIATGTDSTARTGTTWNPYSTVRFDGTADSLSRGANLTGMPTGATSFTFACRVNSASFAAAQRLMACNLVTAFDVQLAITTGNLTVSAADTSATVGWGGTAIATGLSTATWYTLHITGNLTTGRLRCWVNGTSSYDVTAGATGVLDWQTLTNWRIAINAAGTAARLNGDMRWLWFDVNQEVTDPAKFTTGDLGTQGSGTGLTRPLVFYTGAAATWNAGTNGGTGGNFTMSGAVADV